MSEDLPMKGIRIPGWVLGALPLLSFIGGGGVVYGSTQARIQAVEAALVIHDSKLSQLGARVEDVNMDLRRELQTTLRPLRRSLGAVQLNTAAICQSLSKDRSIRCVTTIPDGEE